MRVFITGGTGFVGSALIPALVGNNHTPVVLVREGEKPVDQSLGAYLYLTRARATLELAMLGAISNKDQALAEVAADLEVVKEIEPGNISIYRYLAGAAVEQGKMLASKGLLEERDRAAEEAKTLLENAVKYTPDGGKIRLIAELRDANLVVSINDSGPGIPEEMRNRIFEKFSRIRYQGAPKGVGLGLNFCKLAVEAHEGKIWVRERLFGDCSLFSHSSYGSSRTPVKTNLLKD